MQKSPIPGLSDRHYHELSVGSGITDGQIIARGWATVTDEQAKKFFKGDQARAGLLIPIHTVDGTISHYRLKPDDPRKDEKGKPLKYEQPARTGNRLDIPSDCLKHLQDTAILGFIAEGEKKVDSIKCRSSIPMLVVGITGCWGWRNNKKQALADFDKIDCRRAWKLGFDGDFKTNPGVRSALQEIAIELKKRGATSVSVIVIPEPHKGADDYLVAGGTVSHLLTCVDNSAITDLSRPRIEVGEHQQDQLIREAEKSLIRANHPPEIFIKDGRLCEIARDEHSQFWIGPMSAANLYTRLVNAADWVGRSGSPVGPTRTIIDSILESHTPLKDIPVIEGISACPILGKDGTFVSASGYDPSSRWFITAGADWEPWVGSAQDAAIFLGRELFGEFPFEDAASLANTMGLLFTPFVRQQIKGSTPIFYAESPTPRTGKGMLLDVALIPALGDRLTITKLPDREEEVHKTLFTMIKQGMQVICIDNVKGKVGGDTLEAYLTADKVAARLMGLNEVPTIKVKSLMVMTANNARVTDDLAPRIVKIRLNAHSEDPEWREFVKPDVRAWTLQNRPKIIGAVIACVLEWVRHGRPLSKRRKGGYEEWIGVIGGILDVCGVPGLCANDAEVKKSASVDLEELRAFVCEWWVRHIDEITDAPTLRNMALNPEGETFVPSVFDTQKNPAVAFGRWLVKCVGKTINVMDPMGHTVTVEINLSPPQRGVPRFKLTPVVEIKKIISYTREETIVNDSFLMRTRIHAHAHGVSDLSDLHQSANLGSNGVLSGGDKKSVVSENSVVLD